MNGSQIRINLLFDANVAAARGNVQELASLLQQIATPKTVTVNGGAIQQAAQAARTLQSHLQNAMNTNTGKLDLTKLNMSLKQAGTSVTELSRKLIAAGPQGQQAFTKLANSIASAGVPAAQLNATITQFLRTMGSAVMWSAAYGALNAVGEAFNNAVTYAKDLNKALTDIAIVSDLTAGQLDEFAVKAAKAAKTLNTTTTEYAKAALIFFQQGLTGKEVEERANAVVKMAQVTGQTAEVVSDQLTAIWNNFDDGTETLEYYADAITALGAATASSTDEIAQGLEKFAAIAETVGLSYEYATAALATVTAETRQSADVVGTAFKTLFARIGDLELGETLDDGVTLGKYSQALASVGVEILDQQGQLKDMNSILDEVGSKWNSISKAQQTALAQTVAGMRQYTQFIAIMDNYEEFKINVDIASNAEGTLDTQWEKWEKSYEAASKRVEQSSNELYEALLDDSFIIGVTDTFANFIKVIGDVVDTMGGLGPVILTIVGLFSSKLIPVVTNAAINFVQNWRVMTGAAQRESLATQQAIQAQTEAWIRAGVFTSEQAQMLNLTNDLSEAKQRLTKISHLLTKAQKDEYAQSIQLYEATTLQVQKDIEALAITKKTLQQKEQLFKLSNKGAINSASKAFNDQVNAENSTYSKEQKQRVGDSQNGPLNKKIIGTTDLSITEAEGGKYSAAYERAMYENLFKGSWSQGGQGVNQVDVNLDQIDKVINKMAQLSGAKSYVEDLKVELKTLGDNISEDDINRLDQGFNKLTSSMGLTKDQTQRLQNIFKSLREEPDKVKENLKELDAELDQLSGGCDQASVNLDELLGNMIELFKAKNAGKNLDELIVSLKETENGSEQLRLALERLEAEKEGLNKPIQMTTGQSLAALAGQAGQLASGLSMVVSGIQMFAAAFDSTAEPGQRFMSLITCLSPLLNS